MVKSIINVRRSSICWRGRRELITDVRKPEIMVMTSLWAWETVTDYSITLANLSHRQNSNQQAPDATGFFPVGGMPTASSLAWKTSLRKVRTLWHCSRLRAWRYLWLIVVISVRQSTVAAISGLHCRALVMVSSSIRLTAWLQNSKKRAERSERLMYEQSHRDYLRSGYLHHRLPVAWAVNHYRDNAITYKKAGTTKMPENWSWRTRQLLTCRCVSVMLLRSMQNTRRS